MELFDPKFFPEDPRYSFLNTKGYRCFINPGLNQLLAVLINLVIELIEFPHVRKSCNLIFSEFHSFLPKFPEFKKLLNALQNSSSNEINLHILSKGQIRKELTSLSNEMFPGNELPTEELFRISQTFNCRIWIITENSQEVTINNYKFPCPASISLAFMKDPNRQRIIPFIVRKQETLHVCAPPVNFEQIEEKLFKVNCELIKLATTSENFERLKKICENQLLGKKKELNQIMNDKLKKKVPSNTNSQRNSILVPVPRISTNQKVSKHVADDILSSPDYKAFTPDEASPRFPENPLKQSSSELHEFFNLPPAVKPPFMPKIENFNKDAPAYPLPGTGFNQYKSQINRFSILKEKTEDRPGPIRANPEEMKVVVSNFVKESENFTFQEFNDKEVFDTRKRGSSHERQSSNLKSDPLSPNINKKEMKSPPVLIQELKKDIKINETVLVKKTQDEPGKSPVKVFNHQNIPFGPPKGPLIENFNQNIPFGPPKGPLIENFNQNLPFGPPKGPLIENFNQNKEKLTEKQLESSNVSGIPGTAPPNRSPNIPGIPSCSSPQVTPGNASIIPSGIIPIPSIPSGNIPVIPSNNSPIIPSGNIPVIPSSNSPIIPSGNAPVIPSIPSGNSPAVSSGNIPVIPAIPSGNVRAIPSGNSPVIPSVPSGNIPAIPSVPSNNSPAIPLVPSVPSGANVNLFLKLDISKAEKFNPNSSPFKQPQDEISSKKLPSSSTFNNPSLPCPPSPTVRDQDAKEPDPRNINKDKPAAFPPKLISVGLNEPPLLQPYNPAPMLTSEILPSAKKSNFTPAPFPNQPPGSVLKPGLSFPSLPTEQYLSSNPDKGKFDSSNNAFKDPHFNTKGQNLNTSTLKQPPIFNQSNQPPPLIMPPPGPVNEGFPGLNSVPFKDPPNLIKSTQPPPLIMPPPGPVNEGFPGLNSVPFKDPPNFIKSTQPPPALFPSGSINEGPSALIPTKEAQIKPPDTLNQIPKSFQQVNSSLLKPNLLGNEKNPVKSPPPPIFPNVKQGPDNPSPLSQTANPSTLKDMKNMSPSKESVDPFDMLSSFDRGNSKNKPQNKLSETSPGLNSSLIGNPVNYVQPPQLIKKKQNVNEPPPLIPSASKDIQEKKVNPSGFNALDDDGELPVGPIKNPSLQIPLVNNLTSSLILNEGDLKKGKINEIDDGGLNKVESSEMDDDESNNEECSIPLMTDNSDLQSIRPKVKQDYQSIPDPTALNRKSFPSPIPPLGPPVSPFDVKFEKSDQKFKPIGQFPLPSSNKPDPLMKPGPPLIPQPSTFLNNFDPKISAPPLKGFNPNVEINQKINDSVNPLLNKNFQREDDAQNKPPALNIPASPFNLNPSKPPDYSNAPMIPQLPNLPKLPSIPGQPLQKSQITSPNFPFPSKVPSPKYNPNIKEKKKKSSSSSSSSNSSLSESSDESKVKEPVKTSEESKKFESESKNLADNKKVIIKPEEPKIDPLKNIPVIQSSGQSKIDLKELEQKIPQKPLGISQFPNVPEFQSTPPVVFGLPPFPSAQLNPGIPPISQLQGMPIPPALQGLPPFPAGLQGLPIPPNSGLPPILPGIEKMPIPPSSAIPNFPIGTSGPPNFLGDFSNQSKITEGYKQIKGESNDNPKIEDPKLSKPSPFNPPEFNPIKKTSDKSDEKPSNESRLSNISNYSSNPSKSDSNISGFPPTMPKSVNPSVIQQPPVPSLFPGASKLNSDFPSALPPIPSSFHPMLNQADFKFTEKTGVQVSKPAQVNPSQLKFPKKNSDSSEDSSSESSSSSSDEKSKRKDPPNIFGSEVNIPVKPSMDNKQVKPSFLNSSQIPGMVPNKPGNPSQYRAPESIISAPKFSPQGSDPEYEILPEINSRVLPTGLDDVQKECPECLGEEGLHPPVPLECGCLACNMCLFLSYQSGCCHNCKRKLTADEIQKLNVCYGD